MKIFCKKKNSQFCKVPQSSLDYKAHGMFLFNLQQIFHSILQRNIQFLYVCSFVTKLCWENKGGLRQTTSTRRSFETWPGKNATQHCTYITFFTAQIFTVCLSYSRVPLDIKGNCKFRFEDSLLKLSLIFYIKIKILFK